MRASWAPLGGLLLLGLGCGASRASDASGGTAGSDVGGAASRFGGSSGAGGSSAAGGSSGAGGAVAMATGGTAGVAGKGASDAGTSGAGFSGVGSSGGTGSGGVSGSAGVSGGGGNAGTAGSAGGAAGSGVGGGAVGPACAIPQKIGGSCRFADYCHDRWGGAWDDATVVMNGCGAVDTFDTALCPTAGAFGFCAITLQQGGVAHDASFQYSANGAASAAQQCPGFGGTWCAPP